MADLNDGMRLEIRDAMRKAGLKQVQVADALGITTKHLSQMLTGKVTFTLDWADQIAALCGRRVHVAITAEECVFCRIVHGEESATIVRRWKDAVAFAPLDPVTDGHLLVVPAAHVGDAVQDPKVTATTARAAAELARDAGPCNIITSVGSEATQSVFHLHVHVVPRRAGDGLALPWTGQVTSHD